MYSNKNSYPSPLGSSPIRRSLASGSPIGSPLKQPRTGACPEYVKDPNTNSRTSSVGTPVEII